MLLVYDNMLWKPGVTVTPSTEAADMDGDNLLVPHPAENWRATSLSGVYATFDLDPFDLNGPYWDTVGLIASSATPHRNGLRYANLLSDSTWTRSNMNAPSFAGTAPPVPGMVMWELTPTASGVAYLQQTYTKPASSSFTNTFLFWLRDKADATTTHGRLYAEGATGADYALADFNLTTGAVNGAASSGGSFSSPAASVVQSVGATHLCRLQYVTSASADTKLRVQALNGSFSPTGVTTANVLQAANPTLDPVGTATDSVINGDGTVGSLWRVRSSMTDAAAATEYDSGWMHLPQGSDLRERSLITSWHRAPSVVSHPAVRVDLFDPQNSGSVLDVGAVCIGPAVAFGPRVPNARGVMVLVEEGGSEVEARGGERYVTIQPRRVGVSVRIRYVTKAEALGELHRLQRLRGRSEPILLVADEEETVYAQELVAYGTLDELDVVEHLEGEWWGDVRLVVRELIAQ